MKILIDPVQYQMILDALIFSSNSMAELLREFINSCKYETIVNDPVQMVLLLLLQISQSKILQTFY
jgi:hypothetical protein